MSLTNEQEEHLEHIIDEFSDLYDDKYRKGAAEHKGNLWDIPALALARNAQEESMDGVGYNATLIATLTKVIAILEDCDCDCSKKALQLLQ